MRGRHRRWVVPWALVTTGTALLPTTALASIDQGERWVARYGSALDEFDQAHSVALSPDGSRVFVTGVTGGISGDPDPFDIATMAYDASSGATLWTKLYNGPDDLSDGGNSVTVSPDGSTVFVTGHTTTLATGSDVVALAYGATTGNLLWLRRYNGPANLDDGGGSVAVSPDGSVAIVIGFSIGAATDYDWIILAYDARTGGSKWSNRLDGPDSGPDFPASMAFHPDGSALFVTGYVMSADPNTDYLTLAYEATTGDLLWRQRLDGTDHGSDGATSLTVSPDGSSVYVTGGSFGTGSGQDVVTVAYRALTGARQWVRRYNGPGNDEDGGYGAAVSPDSSTVFVTGYSMGTGTELDYATVAYDGKTGDVRWARRYNGPGNDRDIAVEVATSLDGLYVYATGFAASGDSGDDCVTVSYLAATGASVGVRRYNGPGNGTDWGGDIAVSSDSVFVTGWGDGDGTWYDYATLAYQI